MNQADLQARVLACIDHPMAYPEIERAVGRQPRFALGIALARLVVSGALFRKEPTKPAGYFASHWPVYSRIRLSEKFKNPARSAIPTNDHTDHEACT